MTSMALTRRLDVLRRAGRVVGSGGMLIVFPDAWPAAAWAANEAARTAGDHQRRADILHAQTGRRASFGSGDAGDAHADGPR
jgi:hypothetical protein